jgi:hypothetical protein
MDHRQIDENAVAERYVKHDLPPRERAAFESHMVDCQECVDRVMLAEMFLLENGGNVSSSSNLPLRARIVAGLSPWQLFVLLAATGLLLLAAPTAWYLWDLHQISNVTLPAFP